MIPEKIRQRQRAELAAIHRLDAAGYTVEGWNHITSLCTVARLDGLNTNHDKPGCRCYPRWASIRRRRWSGLFPAGPRRCSPPPRVRRP